MVFKYRSDQDLDSTLGSELGPKYLLQPRRCNGTPDTSAFLRSNQRRLLRTCSSYIEPRTNDTPWHHMLLPIKSTHSVLSLAGTRLLHTTCRLLLVSRKRSALSLIAHSRVGSSYQIRIWYSSRVLQTIRDAIPEPLTTKSRFERSAAVYSQSSFGADERTLQSHGKEKKSCVTPSLPSTEHTSQPAPTDAPASSYKRHSVSIALRRGP